MGRSQRGVCVQVKLPYLCWLWSQDYKVIVGHLCQLMKNISWNKDYGISSSATLLLIPEADSVALI